MDKDDQGPHDPFSPLAEGSAQLHTLYESYLEAGFTPGHSIYLVGVVIKASMGAPGD